MIGRILVGTDFSTRSDRALRRATLLARQTSAELVLVNVIDSDLPLRMRQAEEREAAALLCELAGTVQSADGIPCDFRVSVGEPFEAIPNLAEEVGADLVVMGPHRRQALRDIFVGTTVERTIRQSHRPVIMANAAPVGPYERVLIATDFSDCSMNALRVARKLGLLEHRQTTVLHAFDAPAQTALLRASVTTEQLKTYIAEERARAEGEMEEFLRKVEFPSVNREIQLIELVAAETIRNYADNYRIDLIVLGTNGRTGAAKFLLGSVAEEVLRYSLADVLVVSPTAAVDN